MRWSSAIIWELVRNAESQPHLHTLPQNLHLDQMCLAIQAALGEALLSITPGMRVGGGG